MDVHSLLTQIQSYQVTHQLSNSNPDEFYSMPVKIQIEVGDGMLQLSAVKGTFITDDNGALVLTSVNPLTLKI